MFHSIGPGSNGGYHEDPALKLKFKSKHDIENSASINILTQDNDDMSDFEEEKHHVEERHEEVVDGGLCLQNSSSTESGYEKHQQQMPTCFS